MKRFHSFSTVGLRAIVTAALSFTLFGATIFGSHSQFFTLQPVYASSCSNVQVSSIIASSSLSTSPASNAIDGSLSTKWSASSASAWIKATLAQSENICSVAIAWYKGNVRQYNFEIYLSTDGSIWTKQYSGVDGGTASGFEIYTFPVTPAKFVEVSVSTPSSNKPPSISEMTISGYSSSTTSGSSSSTSDTTRPSVSISQPSNGATISGTQAVNVAASDNVGVTKVELYVDNVLQSTDTVSPYSFSLDTTKFTNAQHTITAKGYDAAGNVGTSSVTDTVSNIITVPDTTPPTITVPSSMTVSTTTTSAVVTYTVTATDNVGVTSLVCTPASGSTFQLGTTTVVCTAKDAAGNTATKSFAVSVVDPAAPNPSPSTNLYDDFSSGTYSLSDGQSSPNGKWHDVYNGYGSSGVEVDPQNSANLVYYEYPQTSTTSGTTSSDLTLSTQTYHNFKLSLDMRTNQQLRTGSSPNNWENAWIMFDYVDAYHHYYFTLKDSGSELGKKDNNLQQDAQIFLATPTSPSVIHGQWQHVDIIMQGNVITVYVGGALVANVTDTGQSSAFANGGAIGLYNEDSNVNFDNIQISLLSPSSSTTSSTTSISSSGTSTSALYDDFSSGSYSLSGGQTSPNGKWYNHYTGYGSAGVVKDYADSNNLVFAEQPATSTTTSVTHAALTTSTANYHNYKLSLDMRTDKQLRTGSTPNNWENAWIMFNYVDDFHHYYFTLKDSGCELGKKDNNLQLDQQVFLATPTTPSVSHGQWQHIDIVVQNNVITVYVGGVQVATVTDFTQSSLLGAGGQIGLYTEDAAVSFDNVYVTPL